MERYCPQCKTELDSKSSFFCASCGAKLEDSQIRFGGEFFKVRVTKFNESHPKKESTPVVRSVSLLPNQKYKHLIKYGIVLLMTLLILGASLLVYYFVFFKNFKKNIPEKDQNASEVRRYPNTINMQLISVQKPFFVDNLTSFTPENPDFYLEGHDLNNFAEKISFENTEYVRFFQDFRPYITGSFALYGKYEKNSMKFGLIIALNSDSTPIDLEEKEYAGLFVEYYGSNLLISNDEVELSVMKEGSSGLARNLTHNPKFSSNKALLSPDGQLIFMLFNDDKYNDIYNLALSRISDQTVTNLIKSVNENKYQRFVIKK